MDSRPPQSSVVYRTLGAFAVLSMLLGLLTAGLAIPAVGAMGSASNSVVDNFNSMPTDILASPMNQQSKILDADGGLIANPYSENRVIVPLSKISDTMKKAQIAIEDSRFYDHGGVDPRGVIRAVISNAQTGTTQGASTLTQQYVKITLVEQALKRGDKAAAKNAVDKNYGRKLQELKYAMYLEKSMTKDQILEGYLNLVYYGDQSYGVEAASQHYFGIPASDLNLGQAAMLAGIVQQPTKLDPVHNPKDSMARRNVVLDRMLELGIVPKDQADAAKAVDVKTMLANKQPLKNTCHRSPEPYLCTYMMEYLQKAPEMSALGKTPADRLNLINTGGLTIQTTFKPKVQQFANQAASSYVTPENGNGLTAAISVVEPGTGKIVALGQSTDFSNDQMNHNVDKMYGGGDGHPIGSSAKMFVLATALEQGMPVNSSISYPFAGPKKPYYFPWADLNRDKCGAKEWPVRNDLDMGGTISLWDATAQSVNTAFAQLGLNVGICNVYQQMLKMGMHLAKAPKTSDGKPNLNHGPAAQVLGASEISPLTEALAYATIAANGKYCAPMPIVSITTPDKQAIATPGPQCSQVLDPNVAAGVAQLLRAPLNDPKGTARDSNLSRPAAGKTGTNGNNSDLWFAGFTPQLAAAAWVGYKDHSHSLNGQLFGKLGYIREVFGGSVSAPLWHDVMEVASQGMPVQDFQPVGGAIAAPDKVAVPNVAGKSTEEATQILQQAGFTVSLAGSTASPTVPSGKVASTQPAGQAPRGANIGLVISMGRSPAPNPNPGPVPSTIDPTNPGPLPPNNNGRNRRTSHP